MSFAGVTMRDGRVDVDLHERAIADAPLQVVQVVLDVAGHVDRFGGGVLGGHRSTWLR